MRVSCGSRRGRCVLFTSILDSLTVPCLVYNTAMYTVYGRCGQYGRCMVHALAGVADAAGAWFIWTRLYSGVSLSLHPGCIYSIVTVHYWAIQDNKKRRCGSGKDRRWFGRTASPASKTFNKSRLSRPRHLMSLVLLVLPKGRCTHITRAVLYGCVGRPCNTGAIRVTLSGVG